MLHLILVVVLVIVAAMLFASKEKFAETSFYYEAAPGARAARMICMPEGNGPSLGIAVTKAAKYAATCNAPTFEHSSGNVVVHARKAKKSMADSDDSDDWDQPSASTMRKIRAPVRNLKALSVSGRKPVATTMTQKRFRQTSVPVSRLSGALQAAVYDPSRPPPMMMTVPGKSLGTKPTGCGAGKVWDGKKCRFPKAKGGKKPTGCGAGKVWDGKKCRFPKAKGSKKGTKGSKKGTKGSKKDKKGEETSRGGGSKTTKQKKEECKKKGKKYKNGRCVNKTSGGGSSSSGGGSTGQPCPEGRYRDARTKACRPNRGSLSDERMTERSAQLASSPKPAPSSNSCPPGYEREPKSNTCLPAGSEWLPGGKN
jgi:uncharacterized membrane protein YgcG